MTDTEQKIFLVVITALVTYTASYFTFHRQRKYAAKDAFFIFLSKTKAEIPSRNGFTEFFLKQKTDIPIEFAKLEPFLNNRKKQKFKEAWALFCEIKTDSLDDVFQPATRHYIRQQLDMIANPPSPISIEKPSEILTRHFDLLLNSLKTWF